MLYSIHSLHTCFKTYGTWKYVYEIDYSTYLGRGIDTSDHEMTGGLNVYIFFYKQKMNPYNKTIVSGKNFKFVEISKFLKIRKCNYL